MVGYTVGYDRDSQELVLMARCWRLRGQDFEQGNEENGVGLRRSGLCAVGCVFLGDVLCDSGRMAGWVRGENAGGHSRGPHRRTIVTVTTRRLWLLTPKIGGDTR